MHPDSRIMLDALAKEWLSVKNILVAIESCESIAIDSPMMERTLELAAAFSSHVWLLHVVPRSKQAPFNVDTGVLRREVAVELRHEHEFLHQLAQCVRDREVDATALLVEGPTIRTILRESERLDIDLLVLGCHKHSQILGALMEIAEEGVLSKCVRPTMFVPGPE
jgi:nucleotide-binding universal stress UspA family protein